MVALTGLEKTKQFYFEIDSTLRSCDIDRIRTNQNKHEIQ